MKYFTSNGSTVSIASLDMVKAFDKLTIMHFLKLMNGQVPVCLADWYRKVFACVKWDHCLSKLVPLGSLLVCVRVMRSETETFDFKSETRPRPRPSDIFSRPRRD